MADVIKKRNWRKIIALVVVVGALLVVGYYMFGLPPELAKLFTCIRECKVLEVRENCCYLIRCGLNPPETIMIATYINMTNSGKLCPV